MKYKYRIIVEKKYENLFQIERQFIGWISKFFSPKWKYVDCFTDLQRARQKLKAIISPSENTITVIEEINPWKTL